MAYAEAYIRVTEPDGSEWISVTAFDEILAALKQTTELLGRLATYPDIKFKAVLTDALAAIAKAEQPP